MIYKYDYLISKLHALQSQSIILKNYEKLSKITDNQQLLKKIFPDTNYINVNSLIDIERQAKSYMISQFKIIIKHLGNHEELINVLLARYEIENLKHLIKCFFSNKKKIIELTETHSYYSLDYEKIYSSDISSTSIIETLLKDTVFSFVIEMIQNNETEFKIIYTIDKFYYKLLIDAAKKYTPNQTNKLIHIFKEEIDWQNITWALRLKIYYNKKFNEVKDSFILVNNKNITLNITEDILKKIFELSYIPEENEIDIITKILPKEYSNKIHFAYNNGLFELSLLEKKLYEYLNKMYISFFYKEAFNILPIISFIFLKKKEYTLTVSLFENLKRQG